MRRIRCIHGEFGRVGFRRHGRRTRFVKTDQAKLARRFRHNGRLDGETKTSDQMGRKRGGSRRIAAEISDWRAAVVVIVGLASAQCQAAPRGLESPRMAGVFGRRVFLTFQTPVSRLDLGSCLPGRYCPWMNRFAFPAHRILAGIKPRARDESLSQPEHFQSSAPFSCERFAPARDDDGEGEKSWRLVKTPRCKRRSSFLFC